MALVPMPQIHKIHKIIENELYIEFDHHLSLYFILHSFLYSSPELNRERPVFFFTIIQNIIKYMSAPTWPKWMGLKRAHLGPIP